MTQMTYQWIPERGAYVRALSDATAAREQQQENSGRPATQSLRHDTTGVGQIVLPDPQRFDTTFLEPPMVTSGMVLVRTAGEGWAYPQVSAGVYRWLTNEKGYITGAFLYFNVHCDPDIPGDPHVTLPSGVIQSQILSRQARLRQEMAGTTAYFAALADLQQAQMTFMAAKRAEARDPANPVITHHLLFQGLAMKELPESVTAELNDF